MKILMLHQHFRTPSEGGGIRSFHVANALAAAGHDVIVISARKKSEWIYLNNKITIHYLSVDYSNHQSFYARIYSFAKFLILAYRRAIHIESVDLIYAISTPLTVGWLGMVLKKKLKLPFIFEVGDLWPDAPIQIGAIKNKWLCELLYHEEKRIYRASDSIISLSPDITDYISRKNEDKKISTIPNMADLSFFEKAIKIEESDTFTIGYFGTIGEANAIEYLINAAQEAENQKMKVQFLIMGTGKRKDFAIQEVNRLQLKNVFFLEFANYDLMRSSLKKCDAVYVSFSNIPILTTGSPNKFFDGLASGKIIVLNFGGWIADLMDQHEIGFYYNPLIPEQFCEKLKDIFDNPEKQKSMKANALQLARDHFDKEFLTTQVVQLVESHFN